MQKTKNAIIHIGSLFLIQWLSITVIILNASALNASKDSNQGLVMAAETGPQDFILLIMSATSLFAVSLLLCLYLQLFFRLLGKGPISLSRSVLYVEVAFAFIIISFWLAATIIVLNHFNASSSCRHPPNISNLSDKVIFDNNRNLLSSTACNLMNATIILAFITIGTWLVPLCASIYSLLFLSDFHINSNSPIHPYENVKLQISRRNSGNHQQQQQRDPVLENDKLHYSTMTTIRTEDDHSEKVFIISAPNVENPPPFEGNKEIKLTPIINPLPLQQQQPHQQRSYNSMQQPQEPESVVLTKKTQHDWTFDFEFEPVSINLMLPTSSDLVNVHDREKKYYT